MPKEYKYKYKMKFGECLTRCKIRKKDKVHIASFTCTQECSNFISIIREIKDGIYRNGIILCKGEEICQN